MIDLVDRSVLWLGVDPLFIDQGSGVDWSGAVRLLCFASVLILVLEWLPLFPIGIHQTIFG